MIERNSFRLRLSGMKHVQDPNREFPGLPACGCGAEKTMQKETMVFIQFLRAVF